MIWDVYIDVSMAYTVDDSWNGFHFCRTHSHWFWTSTRKNVVNHQWPLGIPGAHQIWMSIFSSRGSHFFFTSRVCAGTAPFQSNNPTFFSLLFSLIHTEMFQSCLQPCWVLIWITLGDRVQVGTPFSFFCWCVWVASFLKTDLGPTVDIRQTNAESVPTESEHPFEFFPIQILIQNAFISPFRLDPGGWELHFVATEWRPQGALLRSWQNPTFTEEYFC